MRRTAIKEANQKQRKTQGQVKRTLRSTRKRCAERIAVEDNVVHNYAGSLTLISFQHIYIKHLLFQVVEPAISSHAFPSSFRVPILQNADLLCPQLQSSLPLLATIDSLKSQGSALLDCKQAVANILSSSSKASPL